MRQKFGAHGAAEDKISRNCQGEKARPNRDQAVMNRPAETISVALTDEGHDRVLPLFSAFGKGEICQDRRDDDGKDQCPKQRKNYGPSHGMKESAFDALQSENRHERCNSDDNGVEDRTLYFMRGEADALGVSLDTVDVAGMAPDVFDQYDGAFHDHTEVQRAQRQQVGRNVHEVKTGRSEKQGKRNG